MESTSLLVELGGVILALGVLGRFARRYGLSPIPIYLLAGLAFGQGGLLPLATGEEFIEAGANIGVVLLLLLLGIEYSASELVTNLRAHAPSGVVDAVLNALPGLAAGLLLGWGPVAAVALAGVTWVSSSGIIAKVLTDLGRLANRETPVVLSILVFEDLAMAAYLPILSALLVGGLASGWLSLVIALVALSVTMLVALRYGRAVSRLISTPDPEALLLSVFGLALLVAGIAEQVRVSAAVGAFLVGIALSGRVAEGAREILGPLRDLFAAVFFVFFGLRTDPASIPSVALPAFLLAVVSMVTKVATGYWAARRAGIGRAGRLRAGGVLVARGEFSIVIAGLVVAAGVEPRFGAFATAYMIFMVLMGPLTARLTEPAARRLRGLWASRVARPAGLRRRPEAGEAESTG